MKIVIIGCGKVGRTLSASLSNGKNDVILIDRNTDAIMRVQDMQDVMCIEGDGADVDVQLEANVDKSGLLIAATTSDELNILCCLIAKNLGVKKTISRVRNPLYYKQMDIVKEDLGLSMVINPELTTADEILRILMFPAAAQVEVFAKGRMELVEYKLDENSLLDGKSLIDIYKIRKIKFLICAVERDSEIFIPSGDFILHSGDKVYVAASHRNLENFFKDIGVLTNKVKTVMIVGGGRIAHYLTRQLLAIGMRVKIIENKLEKCRELAETFTKATIIYGDGTDSDLLEEEGIRDVDAFVSLTGMDEENIIMSLFAKNNSNAKIITKINRDNYVELALNMGLDTLLSPRKLAASLILSFVRSIDTSPKNIEALYHIAQNQVEAIEFKINEDNSTMIGVPLKSLKIKKNILICGIMRERKVIIPGGDDYFKDGDSVIVISKDHQFSNIEDILE